MSDTILAIATTPGPSGLGVLRLSGPQAVAAAARLFSPADGRPLGEQRPRFLAFGRLRAPEGALLDQGLAVRFEAGASFTGEAVVELQLHGGAYHLQRCRQALLEAGKDLGLRLAEPGEFMQRAFLAGRIGLPQAEAVADLVASGAALQHDVAAAQLEGGLAKACASLRQGLLEVLAEGEAACDLAEDEAPALDAASLLARLAGLRGACARLLASAPGGRLASEGVKVVLLGPANAGKSSLFNALLGRERALVHPEPGTTRDYVEAGLELQGLAFTLVDTAGLREAAGAEAAGVALGLNQAAQAGLTLLVVDASRPMDEGFLRRIGGLDPARCGLALNFSDRGALPLPEAFSGLKDRSLALSALTGQGVEELKRRLVDWALVGQALPRAEAVLVCKARHEAALRRCEGDLAHVERAVAAGVSPELWCVDVRAALDALGELDGGAARKEVLKEIFSRFCVGK